MCRVEGVNGGRKGDICNTFNKKMNLKRSERRECRQYLQEVDWGPGRDAKVSKRLAVGWKVTTTSSKLEGTRRNRVNGAQ